MKNQIKKTNFAGSKSQMHALLKNMTKDLLFHEYLTTTKARAKAVKAYVDKLLSGLIDDENSRRILQSKLGTISSELETKIFKTYIKRFTDRSSGFTKSYNLGRRKGDSAEMMKLILVGYKVKSKSKLTKLKTAKKEEKSASKSEPKKQTIGASKDEIKKSQVKNVITGRAQSRSGI